MKYMYILNDRKVWIDYNYMNFRIYKDFVYGMCDYGVCGCEFGIYRN